VAEGHGHPLVNVNVKEKVNMKQISKAWKLDGVSLHTSNHDIHMVDFMSSNSMVANIKEFICVPNTIGNACWIENVIALALKTQHCWVIKRKLLKFIQ